MAAESIRREPDPTQILTTGGMRFMFGYLHGKISKRFSTAAGGGISGTPPGTPVGGQFDAVVMRTQVAF